MFGAQANSKRPSAPAVGFASATRDVRDKVFMASEDAPKQRRAADHSIPPPPSKPSSYNLGGRNVQLYTATQLEQTDRAALRRRAQVLQEVLGAENLPKLPHHFAEMGRWILDAQVVLSASTDSPQSLADFGGGRAPSAEERGEVYFGDHTDKWIKNPAALSKKPDPRPLKPQAVAMGSEAAVAYMEAQSKMSDNKYRNRTGSNIFGGRE